MRPQVDNEEFCKNYEKHEIYKKKIKALQNFARTVDKFDDWVCVELAMRYSKNHFLSTEMCILIDSILKKYHIDYLEWCCQTKWVISKIDLQTREKQGTFPFEDLSAQRQKAWESAPFPSLFHEGKYMTCRSA